MMAPLSSPSNDRGTTDVWRVLASVEEGSNPPFAAKLEVGVTSADDSAAEDGGGITEYWALAT